MPAQQAGRETGQLAGLFDPRHSIPLIGSCIDLRQRTGKGPDTADGFTRIATAIPAPD
jgi:hypothetical protein